MIIKTYLYNKEVELVFDSYRHTYTVTDEKSGIIGEKRPSATTALGVINKPQLVNWAAKLCAETIASQLEPGKSYDELQLEAIIESGRKAHFQKKVDAGTIGSFVHKWVEDYVKGKNPSIPVNEQLATSVRKFLGWVEKHEVKFLLSEQQVYSRKYQFTGTLDFICRIDGLLYLGDLKTTSGIYPEMLMQTAAYRFARTEEYPAEDYKGQIIVRVGKDDGALEVGRVTDEMHPGWYKKFLSGFIYALELQKSTKLFETFNIYTE